MSLFPDWETFAVVQRRPETGCIPTGYEMILRATDVTGIDFDTFQDDFDIDKDLKAGQLHRNNFESVANLIHQKYPHVNFKIRKFSPGCGDDKLKFIEEQISKRHPVLISLFVGMQADNRLYHIMPVVDANETRLMLLKVVLQDGKSKICLLPKSELIRIHNENPGGDDVAYFG